MGSLGVEVVKRKKAMWLYPKVVGFNPPERWGHSACFADGVVYVFGGCCGGLHFSDALALNLEAMSWSSIVTSGQKPGTRDSHTASIVGQKMFVFGGTDGAKKVNDLHILDLRTKEWSKPVCKGIPPSPRESHTATLCSHDKLVIFGGSGEGEANYLNDVHVLDIKDMTWSSPETQGDPPAPRDSHTAVAIGNKLLIYGGDCGDRYHGEVDVLDMDTMIWSQLAVEGSTPGVRAGHAAVNIGDKVYIIGGVGEKQYYNDVWVLDIGACSWSRLDIRGQQPQGRFSHTAVVTNTDIAIYGGCGEDERPLNELLILQLGSEHPNGRYNISMCKLFGKHWIQDKRKYLRTEILQNNTVLKNGDLSHRSSEGDADASSGILHCTNNVKAKRRKLLTSNARVWDIGSEQEEHSLSLSQQSSPSRSDQEQNMVQKLRHSANENILASQQLAQFKLHHEHDHIRSVCRAKQDGHIVGCESPRQLKNEQLVRSIFQQRQEMQFLLDQKPQIRPAICPMSFKVQIGAEVYGSVDAAFDSGYLMTASVNGQILKGVLFAPGPGVAAPRSQVKLQGGLTVHNAAPQHSSNAPPHAVPLHVMPPRQSMSLVPECGHHIRQVNHAQVRKSQAVKINSDLQGVVLTLGGPGS